MRYDLTNNQSTPFYNDIGAGREIDADQNEGLVFFNDYFSDTLCKMNYRKHREPIAILNKAGEIRCQLLCFICNRHLILWYFFI